MKTILAAAAPLAALIVAAATPPAAAEPAAKAPRQCFWADNVSGFNAVDDKTVLLNTGPKGVYRLDLFAPCHDVNWSETIAIRSRGGSQICSGLDAEIIAPSTIGPHRCQVSKVTKITEEEAKALRAARKP